MEIEKWRPETGAQNPPRGEGFVASLRVWVELARAKMIRRDIKSPARLKHRDRQIAEPHRLLQKVAAAVVFAGQMARLVIDEEEFWNAHIDLRYALPETVDQPARANRAHKRLRLTIAR